MFKVTLDSVFERDYKRVLRSHPWIKKEFADAVCELVVNGSLPESYGAHLLNNPGGNYNGHVYCHLSNGKVDVVVLYMPHKSNPEIRFVRMGSHDELFYGSTR